MTAKVVFHLPKQFLRTYSDHAHLAIFQEIERVVIARGGYIEVRRRHEELRSPNSELWQRHLEPENLHIVENGRVRVPNALNAALAYIPPYFHLSPVGALAFGEAKNANFCPADVNPVLAQASFRTLNERLVRGRRTRYGPKREVTDIPQGCIAVFLQGDNPHRQGTAFCDNETLLRRVVAGAGGRKVVVKAHPVSRQLDDAVLVHDLLQEGLDLEATDANLHDILGKCAVTVSYNSAVAMEGFLHHKPAVLFGQSDFHHVAETVLSEEDFPAALERALNTQHDYAKFFHWYFTNYTLSTEDWALETSLIKAFTEAGFPLSRLGLSPHPSSVEAAQAESRARRRATRATKSLIRGLSNSGDLEVKKCLSIGQDKNSFLGTLDGQKVYLHRVTSDHAAEVVAGWKAETERLTTVLVDDRHAVEKVVWAHQDAGLLCTNRVAGATMLDKLKSASGPRRAKMLRMASKWLDDALENEQTRRAVLVSRVDVLKHNLCDLAMRPEDRAQLEDVLERLTIKARQLEGAKLSFAYGPGGFSAEHLILKDGKVTGVSVGACAGLARAHWAAKFLVHVQLMAPITAGNTLYGIAVPDVKAVWDDGMIGKAETPLGFDFFVGEELLRQFVQRYGDRQVKANARLAISAYLRHT